MKEIKFRAWDHRIEDWVESGGLEAEADDENLGSTPNLYIVNTQYHKNNGLQYTFQLSTGIIDKNGKEIYEGDILKKSYSRDTSGKDIIEFTEVVEYEINGGKSGFEITFLESAEIIGNIYENPELLNSDKNDKPSVATDAK